MKWTMVEKDRLSEYHSSVKHASSIPEHSSNTGVWILEGMFREDLCAQSAGGTPGGDARISLMTTRGKLACLGRAIGDGG
jgi:hypothetical protein